MRRHIVCCYGDLTEIIAKLLSKPVLNESPAYDYDRLFFLSYLPCHSSHL